MATGLALLAGSGAAAAGGEATGAATSIDWQRCAAEDLRAGGLKCGFVRVPLDYARPNGKHISIAVSRAKADGKRRGVMLGNYGGPGVQGLDAGVMYLASGASDYDLIGFDPRGMGASRPLLRCTYPTFEAPAADPRPTGKAGSAIGADERRWLAHSKKAPRACAGSGPILEHVTTREIAQDMDRIRRALGVPKISYLGLSYGTYLGQVYATLFPSRVDKMILDSVVDPRGIWYDMQEWQDVALDRALRRFWAWIASHDDIYHLGSTAAKVSARYEAARSRVAVGSCTGATWRSCAPTRRGRRNT